jgi:hypothetical protein
MSYENSAGLGVNNQYGPRDTQDSAALSGGNVEASGSVQEGVIYFTGDEISGTEIATSLVIPAGSRVLDATLQIEEAITMGNADNDIIVGTSGDSEVDGADFDNTTGAAGTYNAAALNNDWAAVLAADTTVAVQVTGTTPDNTAGGKGKVVIRYIKV